MANTIFSDNIVKLSDLRKRQRHWLEIAYHHPVTVTYGQDNLTIINRTEVARLYEQIQHVMPLVEYLDEMTHGKKSNVFPWAENLTEKEKGQFVDDLLESARKCAAIKEWSDFDDLLRDWIATAEAAGNKEMLAVLEKRIPTVEYVALDD